MFFKKQSLAFDKIEDAQKEALRAQSRLRYQELRKKHDIILEGIATQTGRAMYPDTAS